MNAAVRRYDATLWLAGVADEIELVSTKEAVVTAFRPARDDGARILA